MTVNNSTMITEKAMKILQQPVCDHCLGRQFGQLLHGLGNQERGRAVRTAIAFAIDTPEPPQTIDLSNFSEFVFHQLEAVPQKKKTCSICNDLFERLPEWVARIKRAARGHEFKTFLMGTKLSFDLMEKEESLWERVGIDYCEPLKAELNRELGKRVEKALGVRFSAKQPDVNIIINLDGTSVAIESNPLFIYGEYQKRVRGIPQTRWPSGKYKTSIEQIVAKPFMAATKGKSHKLHGMGREDVDARCLGWRPFVLEILQPKKRDINIAALAKKIDAKKVRMRSPRLSTIQEVRAIKETRSEKTYRALVVCTQPLTKTDLRKLSVIGEIRQRTPQRVLHRRGDRTRTRTVKSLATKLITSKKFYLDVRTDAGLYVKELIHGDNGRTEPSVSAVLGAPCVCKELDVLAVHWNKKA